MEWLASVWEFLSGIPGPVYLVLGIVLGIIGWFSGFVAKDQKGQQGENALIWFILLCIPGLLIAFIGVMKWLGTFAAGAS